MEKEETDVLIRFVRRYCALDAASKCKPGRFVFAVGPTVRASTQNHVDAVEFGEFEATLRSVVDSIESCLTLQAGHVFVRAYYTGMTHWSGQIKVGGVLADEPEEGGDRAYPMETDAVTGAIVGMLDTMKMLRGMLAEEKALNTRHHQHQLAATEAITLLAAREGVAGYAERTEAAREMARSLGDILRPFAPMAMAWFLDRQGAPATATAPPATPGEALDRAVGKVEASVGELGVLLQQMADAGGFEQNPAALARLRALVQQVGPAIGLTVGAVP